MAEPFVFHFSRGDHGRPEIMYIADVRAACGLCKHEQIQRFYHATPFHELTLEGFINLARGTAQKTDYECENCGTMVVPEHTLRTTTTLGMADESGVLVAFHDLQADELSFRGTAPRRLDPQELPGFDPAKASGAATDDLDDEWFEHTFDRAFNLKRAWAEFLDEFDDDDDEGWTQLAPGCIAILAPSFESAEAVAQSDEVSEAAGNGAFVLLEITQAPDDFDVSYGAINRWLAPHHREFIKGRSAAVLLSADEAVRLIARTFEVALLKFERVDSDYTAITTPGEIVHKQPLRLLQVLQRAAHTGITPGEAARLSAEEIAAELLRVW